MPGLSSCIKRMVEDKKRDHHFKIKIGGESEVMLLSLIGLQYIRLFIELHGGAYVIGVCITPNNGMRVCICGLLSLTRVHTSFDL